MLRFRVVTPSWSDDPSPSLSAEVVEAKDPLELLVLVPIGPPSRPGVVAAPGDFRPDRRVLMLGEVSSIAGGSDRCDLGVSERELVESVSSWSGSNTSFITKPSVDGVASLA